MIIGMGRHCHKDYAALQNKVVADGVARPSYYQRVKEAAWMRHMDSVSYQWDVIDVFYNFRNDSGGEAYGLYNWKNPATNKLVKTGTVTYTSMDGHMGNGTTGRYATGTWTPFSGPNMYQTTAAVMFDLITDGGAIPFGCNTLGNQYLNLNSWICRLNEDAASPGDPPTSTGAGAYIFTKNALHNDIRLYKNGSDVTQPSPTSTGSVPANVVLYLFCRNNNGTAANFSASKFGFFAAGSNVSNPTAFNAGLQFFKA